MPACMVQRAGHCRAGPGAGLRACARLASPSTSTRVSTGRRPGGSSSMDTWLRSPCASSASVRGMGVAVIMSTCGGGRALAASRARCSTPKLRAAPACLQLL